MHRDSFHPSHTFKGIVKSQILRFARICDSYTDFNHSFHTLKASLLHQGYSRIFLRRCKSEVLRHMNWSPAALKLTSIFLKGFGPCCKPRCACCSHAARTLWASGLKPASNFLISQNISCDSTNVIYGISCEMCLSGKIFYVGLTHRTLRDRLNQHRSNIYCGRVTSVSSHFLNSAHSAANMRVTAIEKIGKSERLEMREEFWMKKLGTDEPPGGNLRVDTNFLKPVCLVLPYHPTSVQLSCSF